MRFIPVLGAALLLATLAGCVSVPVWERDVAALDKMGKGLPLAEVDKVFGRSTVLASQTVEVAGRTYLFRHYNLTVPTGQVRRQTVCQAGGGCMTNFTNVERLEPFAVVFAGAEPKLLAWGKLDDLRKSTDPEVTAVLPQLNSSYTAYLMAKYR
jgi:hypothetical protein